MSMDNNKTQGGNTSDNNISNLAAKAPAAQAARSVATVRVTNKGYGMELSTYITYALPEGMHELYAAPSAGAATTSNDARDAARYKWLRQFGYQAHEVIFHDDGTLKWTGDLDKCIDAILSAHQAKKTEGA